MSKKSVLILISIMIMSVPLRAREKYSCKACCGKQFISVSTFNGVRLKSKLVIWLNPQLPDNGFRIYRYTYQNKEVFTKEIFIIGQEHYTYVLKQRYHEQIATHKLEASEIRQLLKAASKCKKLALPIVFKEDFLKNGLGWYPYSVDILATN
jgi:hypothetical protein